MQRQFKIGDLVSSIDDDIKGKVIAIDGTEIVIEDSDGFKRIFQANELIVYDSKLAEDTSISHKNIDAKKLKKTENQNPDVIDLHNTNTYLPKNKILENQLSLFKNHLNRAIGRRVSSIVFIHGKGEGVLQSGIENILKKNAIKYSDASYQKYGQGAIEVYLFGVNCVVR